MATSSETYVMAFLKSRDESEGMGGMDIEKASGMWEVGVSCFGQYKTNHEIVETSHDASSVALGHASAVFSYSDIADVYGPLYP